MNLLRSTALAACALLLGGCGLDVMYADWRVDRLCKQDGGVKVFETDRLPAEFRMPDGNVDIEALYRAKPGRSFHLVHKWKAIKSDDPTITRLQIELVRGSDTKILGTAVSYIRPMQNIGVPFLHRQGHACPANARLLDLTTGVFFPNSIAR